MKEKRTAKRRTKKQDRWYSYSSTVERLLKEMFKRVGLKYPGPLPADIQELNRKAIQERDESARSQARVKTFAFLGLPLPTDPKVEWYQAKTWTSAEEQSFRLWAAKLMKARYGWSERTIVNELGMFLLNFGWRTVDAPSN